MTVNCDVCFLPLKTIPVEGARMCTDCAWRHVQRYARQDYSHGNFGAIRQGYTPASASVALDDPRDGGRAAVDALGVAIELAADELLGLPGAERERLRAEWAEDSAVVIAEKADVVLYRGNTKESTSHAFTAVARAVAVLSFAPSGCDFMGSHYG